MFCLAERNDLRRQLNAQSKISELQAEIDGLKKIRFFRVKNSSVENSPEN